MTPRLEKQPGGVRLVYDHLVRGDREWDIRVDVDIVAHGDEFRFSATITNNQKDWTVCWIRLPVLKSIHCADSDSQPAVLWPRGLGEKFTPTQFGGSRSFGYPSSYSMQWIAFTGPDTGLYVGCHDQNDAKKDFALVNRDGQFDFSLTHEPYCVPGQTAEIPTTVVMPFEGTWHQAARHYRHWVDTCMPIAEKPEWLRESSGWMLCILKQQNGHVMYPYDSLDRIADLADERGLDILGLFGWAHGGHDRDYPDYRPDRLMGGREALCKAIDRVQERGMRVVLYANGVFIDAASQFYIEHGHEAICAKPNSEPYVWFFDKFRSSSVPVFVQACSGSDVWYERLLALGKQAKELGADGILVDSVAAIGATKCFAQDHQHENPAQAYAECRMKMVHRLAEELRRDNPEFIVMTEALIGSFARDLVFFHGLGNGFGYAAPGPNQTVFPEMFRFTFPEVFVTQREPCPMLDRNRANYACTYGLRHEIESRYEADVKYLLDGIVPTADDYSDCNSPPPVDLIQSTSPREATDYLRAVIELERRHAGLLWNGRFIDTQGFDFEGDGIVAKGFRNGDMLGVVVWNPTQLPQTVQLQVPGHDLQSVDEPNAGTAPAAQSPIPPETVRLFTWAVRR